MFKLTPEMRQWLDQKGVEAYLALRLMMQGALAFCVFGTVMMPFALLAEDAFRVGALIWTLLGLALGHELLWLPYRARRQVIAAAWDFFQELPDWRLAHDSEMFAGIFLEDMLACINALGNPRLGWWRRRILRYRVLSGAKALSLEKKGAPMVARSDSARTACEAWGRLMKACAALKLGLGQGERDPRYWNVGANMFHRLIHWPDRVLVLSWRLRLQAVRAQ